MESLIFFLVVVIIVITNIMKVKKKLKESKPSEEGRKKGWKENLKDLLAEMQKEMEKASGESSERKPRSGRPAGWEQILPPDPAQPGDVERVEEPSRKAEPKPAARPMAAEKEPRLARQRETLIESRLQRGQTPEARMEQAEKQARTPVKDRSAIGKKETPLYGVDTYTYPEVFGAEQKARRRYGKKELQKAVVWYEVLGPPMSLRDPEREMWL